jgi:Fe-only nitrogenase accessory protein AnfO
MKIAVHVNHQDEVASLYEAGFLRLYEKTIAEDPANWRATAEIAFAIDADMPLPLIKTALHAAWAALDGCKLLVSAEVRGLIYSVLQEELGVQTWKSEGSLQQQLDMVSRKQTEQEAKRRFELVNLAGKLAPAPMRVGDPQLGHFWIDLKDALAHESAQTSRQILIPFLSSGHFCKLDILCDHLPKWLSWELERLNLSAESEEIDATSVGLRVTVYARNTPEGLARQVGLLGAGPALQLACPKAQKRQQPLLGAHLPLPSPARPLLTLESL